MEVKWEVLSLPVTAGNELRLVLENGWEPFAVVGHWLAGATTDYIYLRRRTPTEAYIAGKER